jgi:hypothetical protein
MTMINHLRTFLARLIVRWQFMGATLLGVIYPLGTWAIVKCYPETDWFAWRFMAMTGGLIAVFALFRFVASLWA